MNDVLLTKLENLRQLMIQSGMKHGLRNEQTVKLSHEFDQLMNVYVNSEKTYIMTKQEVQNNFY